VKSGSPLLSGAGSSLPSADAQGIASEQSLASGTMIVTDSDAFGGNGGLIAVNPVDGRQTVARRFVP
jgi:hypothetical protein